MVLERADAGSWRTLRDALFVAGEPHVCTTVEYENRLDELEASTPLRLSDLALPHGARVLFYGDGALRQVVANVLAASQLRGDAGRDELKWTRWEPAGTPDLHKFGRDFPGCVAGADAASSGAVRGVREEV